MRPPLESPEPPLVPGSENPTLNDDSGYGSLVDAEVPSLASCSSTAAPPSLEISLASLRQQFTCTHALATKARKLFEQLMSVFRTQQTRNHPDRIHPADEHILPPDPEQLPLQVVVKLYVEQYHLSSIRRAMVESVTIKLETRATISRYVVRLSVDPHELLQILQEMLGEENMLLSEQVRVQIRIMYLPSAFQECHLHSFSSALEISREDIAEEQDAYSGYLTLTGRVSKISLVEHVIYSQTFICTNPKCNNRNCLHFTPSAARNRVIKRTEDEGFMETGSTATLLPIDLICSHCNMEMPESVIDRVYSAQQKIALDCLHATRAEGCFVNQMEATLRDDLVNTAALGESIQLLGRLSRSLVQKPEGRYLHGIEIDVNNVLKIPDPNRTRLPESIESILSASMSPWNTSQAIVDLLGMDRDDIYVQHEDHKLAMDVRCCCWSLYTSAISSSAVMSIDGALPGEANTKPAEAAPLVELFDLVIAQGESNDASDISRAIATHTMSRHMSKHSDRVGTLLSRLEFSSYIRSASNVQVRSSFECEDLLRAYFQVMRKKGSALDTNEFSSVAVMSTLLNLAACHAKLCFREISDAGDALVSIMMVEETMAARFGTSCLGFLPLPDGKDNIGLLYGAHWSPDSISRTFYGQEELTVPVAGLQAHDFDVNAELQDAGGAANIEETRDRCMERMYAHLMQVIVERSDATHTTALEL
ncbi:unnamed protein product [Mortierella alpina]